MSEVISHKDLLQLVDDLAGSGKPVVGPSRIKDDCVMFVPLMSSEQLALDGFIRPRNSIKEFIFPRHEGICKYRFKGKKLELEDCKPPDAGQVIIGARPCDAAALPILDHVFNWDYVDEFYNRRRQATTVVTLACTEFDDNCFCTSVGLGPAAEKGSDAILLPLGDDAYEVRCLTDKGKALFQGKTESSDKTAQEAAGPEKKFDPEPIAEFLKGNFEHPIWREIAMRCLGCGACAYSCPTCHCFDIVDEGDAAGGYRVKNWDSCQFTMFTMHASGHNPRATQAHRQRQRILHKLSIYPEKFGEILCTGCGNCTRNCPVSLGVLNAVLQIAGAPVGDASEAQ